MEGEKQKENIFGKNKTFWIFLVLIIIVISVFLMSKTDKKGLSEDEKRSIENRLRLEETLSSDVKAEAENRLKSTNTLSPEEKGKVESRLGF